MLRPVAAASVFAGVVLVFNLTADRIVPRAGLPAEASALSPAAMPKSEPEPVQGVVRAVAVRERFDPFGEIKPLPEFTFEQLRAPAFDPSLYRGGRIGEPLEFADLCEVIGDVAEEFEIPSPLFTRLIWQESRFRNDVVSRAGAQGIAQFMPRTAELRGLENPFDPMEALPASADFLRELVEQFGNFGLAAAAYNGGPTRVRNWLAGRIKQLPKETRDYVLRITGHPVEHWRRQNAEAHPKAFDVEDCRVRPIRASPRRRT